MKNTLVLLLLSVVVCCIGCGGKGKIVSGIVKYEDGSLVTNGSVVFDDGKLNFRAKIKSDGSYKTHDVDDKTTPIPYGEYKVRIDGMLRAIGVSKTEEPIEEWNVSEEYRTAEKSPITLKLTPSSPSKFDIVVKKP
jgi:hypothetical protein